MSTHAVIGVGVAPKSVIVEGLNDVVKDEDTLVLPWYGIKPVPAGLTEVYGYVLDNELSFVLYHTSGSVPPKALSGAETGELQEVGNVNTALIKAVGSESGNKVLFLWDDTDETANEALAERVLDTVTGKNRVVDLTNGLVPLSIADPTPPAPDRFAEEDPTDDVKADAPAPFTREELNSMPVPSLKKMAKTAGIPDGVTGKANYIKAILGETLPDFAYPPGREPQPEPEQPVTVADSDPTQPTPPGWNPANGDEAKAILRKSLTNVSPNEAQIAVIEAFRAEAIRLGDFIIDNIPVGRNRSLAITALEDTTMRGVKAILLNQ